MRWLNHFYMNARPTCSWDKGQTGSMVNTLDSSLYDIFWKLFSHLLIIALHLINYHHKKLPAYNAFFYFINFISSSERKPWNCCECWYDFGGSLKWPMHSLTQVYSVLSRVLFWKLRTHASKHLNNMKLYTSCGIFCVAEANSIAVYGRVPISRLWSACPWFYEKKFILI